MALNRESLVGNEFEYMAEAMVSGQISGDLPAWDERQAGDRDGVTPPGNPSPARILSCNPHLDGDVLWAQTTVSIAALDPIPFK